MLYIPFTKRIYAREVKQFSSFNKTNVGYQTNFVFFNVCLPNATFLIQHVFSPIWGLVNRYISVWAIVYKDQLEWYGTRFKSI